jgi:hypothetical protein
MCGRAGGTPWLGRQALDAAGHCARRSPRARARAQQTDADMAAATFCLCPPGATQDSTRMWRALLRGCIPVTFFRANDLPFARHLGVAYSDFIVNLQPDDVGRTQARRPLRRAPRCKRGCQRARWAASEHSGGKERWSIGSAGAMRRARGLIK